MHCFAQVTSTILKLTGFFFKQQMSYHRDNIVEF